MKLTKTDRKYIQHINLLQLTDRIIIGALLTSWGTSILLALAVFVNLLVPTPQILFLVFAGISLISLMVSFSVTEYADKKIREYNNENYF